MKGKALALLIHRPDTTLPGCKLSWQDNHGTLNILVFPVHLYPLYNGFANFHLGASSNYDIFQAFAWEPVPLQINILTLLSKF